MPDLHRGRATKVTQHRFAPGSRRASSRSGATESTNPLSREWFSRQTSSVWPTARRWNGQLRHDHDAIDPARFIALLSEDADGEVESRIGPGRVIR